jgi:AcrR family transcriptional regulator
MAPPRKHETDRILDAARELVLREGPRAASVAAIARESGAPAGTLYHRFASRDELLAAAWLRALERFQQSALAAAASEAEPLEGAVAMGVSQVVFARERPEDARLLVSLRRDDLLDGDPGENFRVKLKAMNAPLRELMLKLTEALRGESDARAQDWLRRAIIDLPNAAVRPHLREGVELPVWLEEDVALAVRRLLAR